MNTSKSVLTTKMNVKLSIEVFGSIRAYLVGKILPSQSCKVQQQKPRSAIPQVWLEWTLIGTGMDPEHHLDC